MGGERFETATAKRAFVVLAAFILLGSWTAFLFAWRPALAAAVGVVVAVAVSMARASRRDDTSESGTVWDVIPSWQYAGRHAESGGLSRDEQERALRDVQEDAENREGRR